MTEKFKNKYRIESTRLPHWNYGWNGIYFITICTKFHIHYLGEIIDDVMQLSKIGKFAHQYWNEIPNHFTFIKLGEFIIMPNHIHGILTINKTDDEMVHERRDAMNRVSTGGFTENKNPMLNKNLSTIIRWYKGRVTFESHKIDPDFNWQPRFYDHIIRNEKSHKNIAHYIKHNITKWQTDKYH